GRRDLTCTQVPDEERSRRAILRSMLIWTPAFGLLTVGAVYMMVEALGGNGGSWFGFSLFALIGVLSGFSALSAFRDWFSEPIETTGQVARKWRKFDLLIFFRAHYVLVARRVYRVPRLVFDEMPEPGGWIYLNHYPHTNALVAWRPLGEDERPRTEEEAAEEAERDAATVEDAWEERRREREREAAAGRERVELPSFGDNRDE
ncbi:MAG: hypothetical protein OXG42_01940, partial [Chloroflexi bacterium]|nr:hypothetical protein [Chloroflexota bacterium]